MVSYQYYFKRKENEIGDAGSKFLTNALKSNHSLQYLYIFGNEIGKYGSDDLVEVLKSNYKIQVFFSLIFQF
jgi:hypothetical protein